MSSLLHCAATATVAFGLGVPTLLAQAPPIARTDRPADGIRTVTVSGVPSRIRIGGAAHLGRRPAIVFEAGGRSPLESWNPIFDEVAAFAPAFAYDRPGNGQSPLGEIVPTPANIAMRLRAVLAAAGVPPPYILVGHSWGGPLIRMFAGKYPSDVAGLVFVDPTDLRSEDEDRAYLRAQGFSDAAGAAHRAEQWNRMRAAGPEMLAAADTAAGYYKEFRTLPPLPDVPVTAFVSDRYDEAPWQGSPCAPRACHDLSVKFRTERLLAITRSVRDGTLIVATGRSHALHADDPALVISAIQRTAATTTRPR